MNRRPSLLLRVLPPLVLLAFACGCGSGRGPVAEGTTQQAPATPAVEEQVDQPPPPSPALPASARPLREKVLRADQPGDKAQVYRDLFLHVGRGGMPDLMADGDTGIALHAAWEAHKKGIYREKSIEWRSDYIYDPERLKGFVAFLRERTKAPVPDWWAAAVLEIDVYADHHVEGGNYCAQGKGRRVRALGGELWLPEGAGLERDGGSIVYSAGGRWVRFTDHLLPLPETAPEGVVGLLTDKWAVLAAYGSSDPRFRIAEFKTGRRGWVAEVWADGSGRRFIAGATWPRRVDLTANEDTVFVFGSDGVLYLEAFALTTGRCRFRFCTSYWGNYSEAWDWK